MAQAHARLSPSASDRWTTCPGSVVLSDGLPDATSKEAAEGTAAHELASLCLSMGKDALAYEGRIFVVTPDEGGDPFEFEADEDMCEAVQVYLDFVRDEASNPVGDDATMQVEVRVSLEHLLGPEEGGTSDVILNSADTLTVIDLKFGRGIRVQAEDNPQLLLYALGALQHRRELGLPDPEYVRGIIVQPRIDNIHGHTYTLDEVLTFQERIVAAGKMVDAAVHYAASPSMPRKEWEATYLHPSAGACQWCRAKATCPALREAVSSAVFGGKQHIDEADFEDLTKEVAAVGADLEADAVDNDALGQYYAVIPLINLWVGAVETHVMAALARGEPVSGWKLVKGKDGRRTWTDKDQAEAALLSYRVPDKDRYKRSLISPADAEKLLKDRRPRQWKDLQEWIKKTGGKPTIVPESDTRPALAATRAEDADFDDLTQ